MSTFASDFIEGYDERWSEVNTLIDMAQGLDDGDKEYCALCRATIVLIVANFEGFIYEAMRCFINDVNSNNAFSMTSEKMKMTYCTQFITPEKGNERKLRKLVDVLNELDTKYAIEPFLYENNKNPKATVIEKYFEEVGGKNFWKYISDCEIDKVFENDSSIGANLIEKMNVLNTPFSDKLPLASLHWIISDSTQSITVESVIDGIKIYDNPVGVLTNNPSFDKQMFALNNYMYLSPKSPENKFSKELDLSLYSRGMGAIGLPGDLSSQSRFIRVAYTKLNSFSKEDEKSSVSQFFHILGSVDQQRGCCDLGDDKFEITIYTSCCNVNKGIYYYTTYDNHQITAVDMHKENLDSNVLIRYPLIKEEQIRTQN